MAGGYHLELSDTLQELVVPDGNFFVPLLPAWTIPGHTYWLWASNELLLRLFVVTFAYQMKLFTWVLVFQPTHLELSAEKQSFAGVLSRAKREEARSNIFFGKTV